MQRCAFLTIQDPAGYVIDDELAYGPLAQLGWRVDAIPWDRSGVDWRSYDAVVIRSTWDYIKHPNTFLAVLEEIERSGVPLFNPLDVVRWNINKIYLRDLADRGVPVVPTVWLERLDPDKLPKLIERIGTEEIVLKPIVGANASGTFRISARGGRDQADELSAWFTNRALMAQPFLSAITTEGEFSLFYFNGEHSHTILKTPKPADFRVQEEHGGIIRAYEADSDLRTAGDAALEALDGAPLYARADFVRKEHGAGYWLMELELIEPSLYFRTNNEAPFRFAEALDRAARSGSSTRE
ncbi:MAG: RimK family alpha-L-glutamate ligase [Chthoniobacterales bacterium]